MQFHHLARKETQMFSCLLTALWFIEALAMTHDQAVATQHQPRRLHRSNHMRLGHTERLGDLAGRRIVLIGAGAMGEGGETFVLDMGTPIKIADMARDLIKLSGFEPDVDIQIE